MKKTLGLDLGIASIGWCLFKDKDDGSGQHERIIDLGSFVFSQIEDGKSGKTENILRRQKRSMRRQRRRRFRRRQDGRYLFQKELGVDFLALKLSSYPTPMDLKVKGLHEKLTKEELSIALYHYLKYRGFKSNKKSEKLSDGKLSKKLDSFKEELGDRYITEYLWSKPAEERAKLGERFHNAADEYTLTVYRDIYLKEINALLDKQIELGTIGEDFKEEYIALFTRQRDFSDGPAEGRYKKDLEDLIGKCIYDNNPRAPKDSLSAQEFIFLSKLANLRYKDTPERKEYLQLTAEEIAKVEKVLFAAKQKVTYKAIFDVLKKEPYRIKALELSKSEYKKCAQGFDKDHGLVPDKGGNIIIPPELIEAFGLAQKKALLEKTFFSLSDFQNELSKKAKGLKTPFGEKLLTDRKLRDKVARISLVAKTDARIAEKCKDEPNSAELTAFIQGMEKEAKAVIDLSFEVLDKILPYLRKGKNYFEALVESGIQKEGALTGVRHSFAVDVLPNIDVMLKQTQTDLRNPVVKHALVQLRTVLNAIIKTYGKPDEVYVELGRELRKGFEERREITKNQLENRERNTSIKLEILENFHDRFSTLSDIRHNDLVKYRLFKEQRGVSPYTNKPIIESEIFGDGAPYEVDHIIPYSRSFDDSFNNKVLVERAENRNKGNRTPHEYGIDDQINRYLSEHYLPRAKQDRLRAKSIDDDEIGINASGFLSKDANDNAYIAKIARILIETYILPKDKQCHTVSGATTEKLRSLWNVGGMKHTLIPGVSFESHYRTKTIESYHYKRIDKIEKGLRFIFSLDGKEVPFDVLRNEANKNGEISVVKARENEHIDAFINNLDYHNSKFSELGLYGHPIDDLIAASFSQDIQGTVQSADTLFVLAEVKNLINETIIKKDRNNDLHHAVDAAVIACATPAYVKRIADYYKAKEIEAPVVDEETGEVVNPGPHCPKPYDGFDTELALRVYERDINKAIEKLNELPMYKDDPATRYNVHLIYPARRPDKDVKGAISKDTIFGSKTIESKTILFATKSVKKLDKKSVENIVDKDGGSKATYLAVKAWLGNHATPWPMLPKKNVPIKKVKIKVADSPDGRVDLSNGRYADNSDVVRLRVYKKKEDDGNLYIVPVYYNQIWREEQARKKGVESHVSYTVMFAQRSDGSFLATAKELESKFDLQSEFGRYSMLEITTKKGDVCLAYSGGGSSGMMEVYSILGDGYDLVKGNLSGTPDRSQFLLTISTLKGIRVRNISPLGKIS